MRLGGVPIGHVLRHVLIVFFFLFSKISIFSECLSTVYLLV